MNKSKTSNKGGLVVMSAPSGAGKTTIVRQLVAQVPNLVHSVSCTTRVPRPNERQGHDYHFVDATRFAAMIAASEFLEWAEVHGARYGTPKAPLEQWLRDGKDVILDLDVQGWRSLRRRYPEAIAIFLMPPSRAALVERLKTRGTEDAGALQRRVEDADREMTARDEYHHVVTNDSIDTACAEIAQILRAYRGDRRP